MAFKYASSTTSKAGQTKTYIHLPAYKIMRENEAGTERVSIGTFARALADAGIISRDGQFGALHTIERGERLTVGTSVYFIQKY